MKTSSRRKKFKYNELPINFYYKRMYLALYKKDILYLRN